MEISELATLDKLLATEVMGWANQTGKRWFDVVTHEVILDDRAEIIDWHPTTDIAQAFMVAEKVTRLELFHSKKFNSWHAKFTGAGKHGAFEVSDTAALAICLAAAAWLDSQKTLDLRQS